MKIADRKWTNYLTTKHKPNRPVILKCERCRGCTRNIWSNTRIYNDGGVSLARTWWIWCSQAYSTYLFGIKHYIRNGLLALLCLCVRESCLKIYFLYIYTITRQVVSHSDRDKCAYSSGLHCYMPLSSFTRIKSVYSHIISAWNPCFDLRDLSKLSLK